jgi:predicted DNA-binding protein YlxM (UPF0122 family)
MLLKTIEELTDEHLLMLEEMGATGFSVNEIAEVLEIVADVLEESFKDKESIVYKRYRKGYLSSQLKLRQRIFLDASHGSSPAQTLAKKIMDDAEYKLKK